MIKRPAVLSILTLFLLIGAALLLPATGISEQD
jgi:hypothetical protein